jgi:hypothetical protein
MSLLQHTRVQGDCLVWTGPRDKDGYGLLRVDNVTTRVNRLAWKEYNGDFPAHLHVLHSCDTPSCIKREHLFLGTHAENMADMANKGRSYRPIGENNPKAKLTYRQVLEIREKLTQGAKRSSLKNEYKVSIGTIQRIASGVGWNPG